MTRAGKVIHVVQGENAISDDPDVVITTILGSCVSACIFDPERGIGGMNHFLLPEDGPGGTDIRYAAAAIEQLLNGLMRRGAVRSRMRSKLFGGARMMAGLPDIGRRNAEAAQRFLQAEGVAMVARDLGGVQARRIRLWPVVGRVQLQFVGAAMLPVRETPMPTQTPDVELF
ncbi:chemotaxis protein CheD [Paracoccus nototheniae]|uniref:chemotaxis protein CheD n=1 Tax=Paracoccus nototheniae TaxID=2489002 RepID=UPI00103FF5F3|nr:chemotaxis protein CheD [Paracoccus nototheniae]